MVELGKEQGEALLWDIERGVLAAPRMPFEIGMVTGTATNRDESPLLAWGYLF